MRVPQRRLDVIVPQDCLDYPHVCTMSDHQSGWRMPPEHMHPSGTIDMRPLLRENEHSMQRHSIPLLPIIGEEQKAAPIDA